jgi:hypothetical protein
MVTFDSLVTGLNQYAVRTSKEIRTLINTNLEWEEPTDYRPCDYSWVEPNMSIGDVLQPYQADIRSIKADVTYSGVETHLEDGMVLSKFTQKELDQFVKTQLYQYRDLGKEILSQELYKIILDKLVLPKLKENINTSAFKGTGGGVQTDGTAAPMLRTFTGYNKRFSDAILGGKVTPAPTGVSTPTNIRTNVRVLCDFVPSWMRYKKGTIRMATSLRQWYIDRMIADNAFTYSPQMGTDQFAIVPGYNKTIVGCDSMEGSQRMVLELDEYPSMIIPIDAALPAMPSLKVTGGQGSDLFTMYVYAPMRRAYGLTYYETTFVNDQA